MHKHEVSDYENLIYNILQSHVVYKSQVIQS